MKRRTFLKSMVAAALVGVSGHWRLGEAQKPAFDFDEFRLMLRKATTHLTDQRSY